MQKREAYIYKEDAIADAEERSREERHTIWVFYDPPRFTGPAGACYKISDDVYAPGRLVHIANYERR